MPQFDKKVEVKQIQAVACFGKVEIGKAIRYSKTGSGYAMISLRGQPQEAFGGVSASRLMLLHPSWLASTFDPASLSIDPVTVAQAKARKARAEDEKTEVDPLDAAVIQKSGQSFVFQNNIYGSPRPALLQTLLGKSFKPFCDAVSDKTPEEFLSILQETYNSGSDQVAFIYEAGQSSNQDGELTQRMELLSLYRIEQIKDVEAWYNGARSRDLTIMFDPADIGA